MIRTIGQCPKCQKPVTTDQRFRYTEAPNPQHENCEQPGGATVTGEKFSHPQKADFKLNKGGDH